MHYISVCNAGLHRLQVYRNNTDQLAWFYLKLAGYSMMVLVRFDDIMGDQEPSARVDVLHMALALSASVCVGVPLAKLRNYDAVPPIAVLVAGGTHLVLHFLRKWLRQFKQARKDRR